MKHLINPTTGASTYAADDHAAALIETGDFVEHVEPDAAPDEAPAKSASRDDWNAYAESKGINPGEYSSKDDLIEAVEAV